MTISNFELADLANSYNVKLSLYDITPKNLLVNYKIRKFMNLIINFAKDGQEGTHFVSLIIRCDKAFYFDSFGGYPLDEVVNYCKKHNLKLGYNTYIIQNIKSTNCGIFCFALIKYLGKSGDIYKKSDEYINLYDNNTSLNDDILFKYLKNCGVDV